MSTYKSDEALIFENYMGGIGSPKNKGTDNAEKIVALAEKIKDNIDFIISTDIRNAPTNADILSLLKNIEAESNRVIHILTKGELS